MIVEQGLLQVRAGQDEAFRVAFAEARHHIESAPGFLGIEVRPASESCGLYLLLVRWRSIVDHRDGFRKSESYEKWRGLLHHFYDPMPLISYFGEPL